MYALIIHFYDSIIDIQSSSCCDDVYSDDTTVGSKKEENLSCSSVGIHIVFSDILSE